MNIPRTDIYSPESVENSRIIAELCKRADIDWDGQVDDPIITKGKCVRIATAQLCLDILRALGWELNWRGVCACWYRWGEEKGDWIHIKMKDLQSLQSATIAALKREVGDE